ncbi:MAG: phosphoribosylformylglycinamidine synthase II, partial [Actinomycetales bacterium]
GLPPVVDLEAEQALAAVLQEASKLGLVTSAHDLSDGGLAQALSEASFRNGVGVTVALEDPFVELFSESTARAVVTVVEDRHDELVALAEKHGVTLTSIGRTGGTDITVEGQFSVPVNELMAEWKATLPAVLGATLG